MFLLSNLLLGEMPETLGLLLFGVALIVLTVVLRWFLSQTEREEVKKTNEIEKF